jgi:PIN domain nuclease of toxin-antitoxin system
MIETPHSYIYLITNLLDGRIYVGKKQINFTVKKKLSKRAKKLPENKRKRVIRVSVDGGWETYWGSCRELKEDIEKLGLHNFKKEILQTVHSKSQASYYELWWQVKLEVLTTPSYNGWIKATVYKNKL